MRAELVAVRGDPQVAVRVEGDVVRAGDRADLVLGEAREVRGRVLRVAGDEEQRPGERRRLRRGCRARSAPGSARACWRCAGWPRRPAALPALPAVGVVGQGDVHLAGVRVGSMSSGRSILVAPTLSPARRVKTYTSSAVMPSTCETAPLGPAVASGIHSPLPSNSPSAGSFPVPSISTGGGVAGELGDVQRALVEQREVVLARGARRPLGASACCRRTCRSSRTARRRPCRRPDGRRAVSRGCAASCLKRPSAVRLRGSSRGRTGRARRPSRSGWPRWAPGRGRSGCRTAPTCARRRRRADAVALEACGGGGSVTFAALAKYWLKFSSPCRVVPHGVVPPEQLLSVPRTVRAASGRRRSSDERAARGGPGEPELGGGGDAAVEVVAGTAVQLAGPAAPPRRRRRTGRARPRRSRPARGWGWPGRIPGTSGLSSVYSWLATRSCRPRSPCSGSRRRKSLL